MSDKLTTIEQNQQMTANPSQQVATMLQRVVDAGITEQNANALDKLLSVFERMEDKRAEQQFTISFNALQSEMPIITATSVIPNRGKYEKFEDLWRIVGPLLSKNGFTVSFSMDFKDNRVVETCTLSHIAGFSRSNSFAVRIGGRADSDTQADCKAATTAKRNAFCNALNLVIQQDCLNEENDAGMEGDPDAKITKAQADELEHRAQMTNSNIPQLLAFAKAKSFADIAANRYTDIDAALRRKEQQGR